MDTFEGSLVGLLIFAALATFGWWFARLNWRVFFNAKVYPRLAYLLFTYSDRKQLLGTDRAPNMICYAVRRAEAINDEIFYSIDFEEQKHARNSYYLFMILFWWLKIPWNFLLIISFTVVDNWRELVKRCS